ncbi:MAG TPA: hypothetical protein VHE61_02475 [Opitutaceae bacterium]|nr:hypothetical protein [Opitutaceae bacterium]
MPTDPELPVVGGLWRDKYEIIEEITAPAGSPAWRGRARDAGCEVILRAVRRDNPDVRAQAWAKLGGIDSPHLQHARDAQHTGAWRVEIADVVPGVPLQTWRAGRTLVPPDTVKAIVAQLAEALAALHAFELVHLGLTPEAVFIADDGKNLHCTIAGLDALTSFDRDQPIPAAADPFYAPPEALGLSVHVPGPSLCGWDWWSLGRVVQELVLGRHIVNVLSGLETRPPTAEARAKAEALLQEADPKGPRAGAVETMTGLDPQVALLLRGLLTSAKESRWTGDNIDRWVRGLPVKEHYATPRADTHFRWRGRPCTVPETAALLQSAEHWADNSVQLFEPTTPGTLAHFLHWSQNQLAAHEQLTSALELADALPLKLSTPAAQREAVTIIALLQLSAGRLIWRGRAFDSTTVSAMLTELGEADGLMILRALSTRSNALQIERIDPEAGRLLTELGRTTGDAEGTLRRHGWLAANDVPGAARLFRLALEPIPTLRATRDTLTQQFAGSDHPAMAKLIAATNPNRTELVLLAWAAGAPERFKFFTHAEAARRRYEALRTRGGELIRALTWPGWQSALGTGLLVFSGWGWLVLSWLLVGSAAIVLWPGPVGLAVALVPVILAVLLRIAVTPIQRRALQAVLPEAKWSWRDGPVRCRRELRTAGRGVSQPALEAELDKVRAEIAGLTGIEPAPIPLPELPRFSSVRLLGVASWVLLAVFAGVGFWRVRSHPVSAKEWKMAWAPPAPAKPEPVAAAAQHPDGESSDGEVKVSWPYKPGDSALKAAVIRSQAAASAQLEFARKHGHELVAPYRPESIDTLIIMPVPAGSQVGVMIFDGKRGELVNDQVYLLAFAPIPRTWIEVAGRKGIFIDR